MKKPLVDRFWAKVNIAGPEECWNWMASINSNGYGQINSGGKPIGAHRYSYQLHYGEIPSGMVVRHKCDNAICVNPRHLEIGTQGDNIHDSVERGFLNLGSKNGCAKLGEIDVLNIKRMIGIKTLEDIARIYGVSSTIISHIKSGKVWRHVSCI